MNHRSLLAGLCLSMSCTAGALAQGTLEHPTGQMFPFIYDTGAVDNPTDKPVFVDAFQIQMRNADWIRAYFDTTSLPEGSFVRLTSTADFESQTLDFTDAAMWSFSSAYFNGDSVIVEVYAGPQTVGTRLSIKQIAAEIGINPAGDPGQCGICNGDQRTPSNELWSGRIMPVGCTGSVYCTTGTGMITAGHCLDGQSNLVVQFNVPASNGNCSTNAPPVADQFPVLPGFQFQNAGIGNDWGVYLTGTNNLGQTPFQRYGQARALAAAPAAAGQNSNIWGYGLDTNCVRSQTQQNSNGLVQGVAADYYTFTNDIRGGNSGSGYLNNGNQIIGVVTHCSFAGCPGYATRIDDGNFTAARNAVNPNCQGGIVPPNNDNCASATAISAGTYTGSTTNASQDGTSSCPGNASRDVWYRLYVTCTGAYRIDTCGSAYDTVLSVHTACPGNSANQIACNDDSCGLQSVVTPTLTAGQSYLIRVAGFGAASGNYVLHVIPPTPPANDACSSAQVIGLGSVNGDNSCASNDGGTNCISYISNDVWYAFTPTCSGTYTADTCTNGAFDTLLSVHTGCPGTAANSIACSDDSCGLQSRVSWVATAGRQYIIRVAGFFANRAGPFTLTLARGADTYPANDACSNAIPVGLGTVHGSTTCASNDGSANCAASAQSPDVWYSFVPDCTAFYEVNTLGDTNYDTALSIHTGCPGTVNNQVACDDDGAGYPRSRIVWQGTAGAQYFIRVNGFANLTGNFQLNIGNLPNDACGSPIQLTDGTVGYSNRGATTDGVGAGICLDVGNNQNINQDVWFYYYASCDGEVRVDTCGVGYDSKLAVYSGYTCPAVNPIACNDDSCGLRSAVTFPASTGQLFQIRIGGYSTATGCGQINIACTPSNPCPGCAADYNQDGGVDGADVNAFFTDWEEGLPCSDVNADGGVDGADVNAFFEVWENGGCGG